MVRWTAAVKPYGDGHNVTIWEGKFTGKMLGDLYVVGSTEPVSAVRLALRASGLGDMEITGQTDPVGESVWINGIAELT